MVPQATVCCVLGCSAQIAANPSPSTPLRTAADPGWLTALAASTCSVAPSHPGGPLCWPAVCAILEHGGYDALLPKARVQPAAATA